jgi:putative transposase
VGTPQGSPYENGHVESFNGKLRDELLNRELFDTLLEAQVLVEMLAAALQ